MNPRCGAVLALIGLVLLPGCSSPTGRGGVVTGGGGSGGSTGGPGTRPPGSGSAGSAGISNSPSLGNVDVSPDPSPACGSPARIASGLSERTIESGGVTRRLLVYVPAGRADDEALPLVLNFHGSGLTPQIQLDMSGLRPIADAEGFVIVAPRGLEQTWNIPPVPEEPDDVRMVADVLDEVESLLCIDRGRVFAAGFSGGARMSSQLACDLSSRIGAVVAVGGVRFPGPCSDARAFPILAFHGTADDVNPYDGGGQAYWQTGVEDAIAGWAEHNGCAARRVERVGDGVDRIGYDGCAELALYRIEGFEHEWPRSLTDELLWAFFQRHPIAR